MTGIQPTGPLSHAQGRRCSARGIETVSLAAPPCGLTVATGRRFSEGCRRKAWARIAQVPGRPFSHSSLAGARRHWRGSSDLSRRACHPPSAGDHPLRRAASEVLGPTGSRLNRASRTPFHYARPVSDGLRDNLDNQISTSRLHASLTLSDKCEGKRGAFRRVEKTRNRVVVC